MGATPALTRAAYGSTRCPGCEKRFAGTSEQAVVEVEGSEENRGRIDSIGQRHRGIGCHAVTRRWHEKCLTKFEESNAAYREQVRQDTRQLIIAICEAAGIDPAPKLAEFDARAQR
jgi:hypothetical protein